MTAKLDLAQLAKDMAALFSEPMDWSDERLFADLDENGVVHLTMADGSPVASMSRETYELLRSGKRGG